jgi:polyisoprenoid-binding protein YceI
MMKSSLRNHVLATLLAAICLGSASNAFANEELTVDGAHSSVLFRVMHMDVAPFYGRFNDVSGSFTIAEDATKSSFNVVIKTESIDTNNKKRDSHLKSPDFFNAREFPTLSFKSTSVARGTDGTLLVTGDLDCHGVTKSINFEVTETGSKTSPGGDVSRGIEAIFTIKRSEFGIKYGLEGGVGDDVRIIVALEGNKKA